MVAKNPPTCFFAYPSEPAALAETLETAIDIINGTSVVSGLGWRNLRVTGRLVVNEICNAINEADIFACDLTFLNPNVLFELGYAVARNKRVWVILDSSFQGAESMYQEMRTLTTVGYSQYGNHSDIVNSFMEEQPFENLENTLYADVFESLVMTQDSPIPILYLKSAVNTDASATLTRILEKSPIPVVTDDPTEIPVQTLTWYAENTYKAHAVIAHLLDDERRKAQPLQNAKYAFVSGLAFGFGKPLLMLAHAPYAPPFDYRDILAVHSTAADCDTIAGTWLDGVRDDYIRDQQRLQEVQKDEVAASTLQRIHLGDHIAENEQSHLSEYFIVTAPFQEALNSDRSMMFVGRKGSGKTANLYELESELRKDKRNFVSIVKPVDYDIEGVLDLLHAWKPRAVQGFLMESLWKFLIYTQIASSLEVSLREQPSHVSLTEDESAFLEFIEQNQDMVRADFTLRLENAIAQLADVLPGDSAGDSRLRISERLHVDFLSALREHLGLLLADRRKVCVIVDNLDKAWRRRDDLAVLSQFILGLLFVSDSIEAEFRKSGATWQEVNLSMIVFLRSDIFAFLLSDAGEADKITFSRMDWNDHSLLRRVIEERFLVSLDGSISAAEMWDRLFCATVHGQPTMDYISMRIISRPRDIIYFCKSALAHAVNHRHTEIEEDDILTAETEYSQYAYSTLVSETKPIVREIESLLVEFAGSNEILTREDITVLNEKAGLPRESLKQTVELLIDNLFFGVEVGENDFRFVYDESRREVFQALSSKLVESSGVERFKINAPFHRYLEVSDSAHEGD